MYFAGGGAALEEEPEERQVGITRVPPIQGGSLRLGWTQDQIRGESVLAVLFAVGDW